MWHPLAIWEAGAQDFTHWAEIVPSDLTQATAGAAQAVVVAILPPIPKIEKAKMELLDPFEDTRDAAFNSTTVKLGDNTLSTSLIANQETNKNGSFITSSVYSAAATGPYAAGDQLLATFTPLAGKSLNKINKGRLKVLVKVAI